jgi:hypothetical protein
MKRILPEKLFQVKAEPPLRVITEYPVDNIHTSAISQLIETIKDKVESWHFVQSSQNQLVSEFCQVFFFLSLGIEEDLINTNVDEHIRAVKGTFADSLEMGNTIFINILSDNLERNMSVDDNYIYFMHILYEVLQQHFPGTMLLRIW